MPNTKLPTAIKPIDLFIRPFILNTDKIICKTGAVRMSKSGSMMRLLSGLT